MRELNEQDMKIALLWQQKMSKEKIGRFLQISPNSVIGKVFRWRKAGVLIDGFPLRETKKAQPERLVRAAIENEEPVFVDLVPTLPEIFEQPENRIIPNEDRAISTLFDRLFDGCAFIVEGDKQTAIYCNQMKTRGSYCDKHHAVMFVPRMGSSKTNPATRPTWWMPSSTKTAVCLDER